MKTNTLNKIFFLFISFVLISCGKPTTEKDSTPSIYDDYINAQQLTSINKINTFRFQGWNSLDYKHLIISSSHNKSFLISLDFYCTDLLHTASIVLDQSINSSLSAKFDSVIVPRNAQMKCRIQSIYELTKQQKNELTALRKNAQ